jgi:methionyl-tRNA formyltransferase
LGERFRILDAEVAEGDAAPGTVIDEALTIACGAGALLPLVVQRQGKRAMTVAELLNGLAIPVGTQL